MSKNVKVVWILVLSAMVFIAGCSEKQQRRSTSGKPLYTARTTLMEMRTPPKNIAVAKRRLNDLVALASSQRVLCATAETLNDLGLKYSADEILSKASITPLKDTNIIAVEVTLPIPEEAKIAADVLASEIRRFYSQLYMAEIKNNCDFTQLMASSAKKSLQKINGELMHYRRIRNRTEAQDIKLAELEVDAKAATERYLQAKRKYDEAATAIQRAKSIVWLRTIDPAVVFPAR